MGMLRGLLRLKSHIAREIYRTLESGLATNGSGLSSEGAVSRSEAVPSAAGPLPEAGGDQCSDIRAHAYDPIHRT